MPRPPEQLELFPEEDAPPVDMPVTLVPPPVTDLAAVLREHAEPLPDIDSPQFATLFDRFADARVVLIGEASHGTAEFYRARAAITRRLVEQHGFGIVAIEGDWPDASAIDQHVRGLPRVVSREPLFGRFPSWMWRNREVTEFIAWLHAFNQPRVRSERVEFRGLDIYSLRSSISAVLAYLERTDPARAAHARARYNCLTPWQDDPAAYGQRVEWGRRDSCEDAVVKQLQALLAQRVAAPAESDEALFDAEQNARVVRAAEQYYRSLYRAGESSWNLRDTHMFDTLQRVMKHRGPEARAVIWAHNSHIGNAAATEMGWQGQLSLGQLCRIAWGEQAVLIGMGTDRGDVAAADDWDSPLQIKQVRPSLADSWEQQFLLAGVPASLTDWRGAERAAFRATLSTALLQRAIGVIYRPDSERASHYFQAVLGEQFDAYLWFAETTAVAPVGQVSSSSAGEADTYPFGV